MIWYGTVYEACHDNDEFWYITQEQYDKAMSKGAEICSYSVNNRMTERKCDPNRTGTEIQQQGEVSAMVVANALYLPWLDSLNTFHGPDLDHNVEARTINGEEKGLKVSPYDDDTKRVVGCIPSEYNHLGPFRMPGWIYAGRAKGLEWKKDPFDKGKPAYWIPQKYLQPLSKLRDIIFRERYAMDKSNPSQAMLNLR